MNERSERTLPWAILVILFLNALWIFLIPAFPTLDGWTHLYTARMLMQGPPDGVFCVNPGIVPNQVGHYVLGTLQLALPAMVAERALLALIVFGTGAGAFALARAFGGRSPVILLVLPFTVNFLLMLGFHNFLLGSSFAMLISAWWIKRQHISWGSLGLLLAATFLVFYTHTTALVLLFLIIGLHELSILAGFHARMPFRGKKWSAFLLFAAACLPTGLLLTYFNASQETTWGTIDRAMNLRELIDLRCLLLSNGELESKFTYTMKLILIGTGLLAVITQLRGTDRFKPRHADVPLVIGLILLTLYFILPDSSGYASFITVRLQLMSLIMMIIWLATRPIPLFATVAPVAMVLLLHIARNNDISNAMEPMADQRELTLDAARNVPEGSVVLPISTEPHWLLGHIGALLGTERDIVVLDNYETVQNYFPLVLCPDVPGYIRDHMTTHDECLGWLDAHLDEKLAPLFDHIILLGYQADTSSCTSKALRTTLADRFQLRYSNAYAKVYALSR